MTARAINGPKNGAHVLRILDRIEHHQQRRAVGLLYQLLNRIRGQCLQICRHALVHTAPRHFLKRLPVHGLHRDSQFMRAGNQQIDP
jgi:hypothetical protein